MGRLNPSREPLAFRYEGRYTNVKGDCDCKLAQFCDAMCKTVSTARLEMKELIDEATKDNKI